MSEIKTEQLLEIIRNLAEEHDTFTSDDIRPLLPSGVSTRQIPAAVGKARRDGLIEEVGRTRSLIPERKGSQVAVFRRVGSQAQFAKAPIVGSSELDDLTSENDIVVEVRRLKGYAENAGYLIGEEELAALLLMLTSRSWVILAGPTGTGKSSIIRILAQALEAQMHDLQVKPNWTSSDDVLGYYSEVAQSFVPGPLLNAIMSAQDDPNVLHLVRFDEMNLASPEYYLAEVLSAAESWQVRDGERVSAKINPSLMPASEVVDPITLRDNILLFGTLNMDETAKLLSPKVLDRAAVYDLHHVDLYSLPAASTDSAETQYPRLQHIRRMIQGRPHSLADVRDILTDNDVLLVADLLSKLDADLRQLSAPVGYRQRDAFLTTVAVWAENGLEPILSRDAVVDICFRSYVLPKLQGSSSVATRALRRIIAQLVARDEVDEDATPDQFRQEALKSAFPRTLDKALDMLQDAETLGYFSSW